METVPLDVRLQRVPHGAHQRAILDQLLIGDWTPHPCYWRGGGPYHPTWHTFAAWTNFVVRLNHAGYALIKRASILHAPHYDMYRLVKEVVLPVAGSEEERP